LKSTIAASLPTLFQPGSRPSSDRDSPSLAAILPRALPAEQDYCNDVHMATIRSVSALFLYLLNDLKQSPSSDTKDLLQPASLILLSSCPISCFDLLVTYLHSSAAAGTHTLTSADAKSVEVGQFHSLLPDIVTEPIRAVAQHSNIVQLEEMVKSLQPLSG